MQKRWLTSIIILAIFIVEGVWWYGNYIGYESMKESVDPIPYNNIAFNILLAWIIAGVLSGLISAFIKIRKEYSGLIKRLIILVIITVLFVVTAWINNSTTISLAGEAIKPWLGFSHVLVVGTTAGIIYFVIDSIADYLGKKET